MKMEKYIDIVYLTCKMIKNCFGKKYKEEDAIIPSNLQTTANFWELSEQLGQRFTGTPEVKSEESWSY